jgi:hypothetical protein
MSISKLSGTTWTDISKVDGVTASGISKVAGVDVPVDYFLDTHSSPVAAYSLRKLSSSATTAITVENSSGTELDIGFDSSGNLDTSALTTHCGSNYGRVSKWWDQSGNNRHMEQSTAASRPYIVDNSGNVLTTTDNSITALNFYFQSTARWLEDTFVSNNADEILISAVAEFHSVTTAQQVFSQWSSSTSTQVTQLSVLGASSKLRISARYSGGQLGRSDTNTTIAVNDEYIINAYASASPYEGDIDFNGETADTDTGYPSSGTINNGSLKAAIGRRSDNGNAQLQGLVAELIIWSATMPTRANVMTDINTHYSIF